MSTLNSNLSENSDQNVKINKVISDLTEQLRKEYVVTQSKDGSTKNEDWKNTILSKIENIMHKLIRDIGERKKLSICMDKISWENCVYNNKICLKPSKHCKKTEIKLNMTSINKFSMICFLLGKIYILLKTNETCNKRELYYRNVEVLQSQGAVDSALNDITNLLGVSLYELNIHTTSKGLIFGRVLLKTPNEEINCSSAGGTLIPNNVSEITEIKAEAKFVLLLEKDTIFHRLLDDEAINNLPPCILITAKGVPDINTRVLLKKIWDLLSIPILALVDPDPWGIEIMCIYRFGSLAMCWDGDRLAVPSIRWLGVFPSEIAELSEVRTPLTRKDKNKIKDLLRRPYTCSIPALQNEIQNAAFKAEVENIDTPQGYLAHKYIPCNISSGKFI